MLKALLGKFGRSSGSKVPIQPVTRTPYFVYLPEPGVPPDEEIRSKILTWWTTHSPPEFCAMGSQLLDGGMVVPVPLDLNDFPACQLLRDVTIAQHPEVAQTLSSATACLSLWASDSLGDPRVGLMFGRAGARAVATARGGIAIDASSGELLVPGDDAPESNRVIADEVVILPHPGSKPDHLSPRTGGVAKYGIPELQIMDVPRGIEYHASKLLLGAAGAIARLAEAEAERAGDRARHIALTSPVTVTGEDVARAMGTSRRFIFTQAQKVDLGVHYHAPKQKRPDIGIPNYVPFLSDTESANYDGIIELRPPVNQAPSTRHWVEELSLQLGLGASATGE